MSSAGSNLLLSLSELKSRAHHRDDLWSLTSPLPEIPYLPHAPRPSEAAGDKKGDSGGEDGGKGEWRKKMIVEGAWIIVVAGVVFAAVVIVVLVVSGKLYDPDRSHE